MKRKNLSVGLISLLLVFHSSSAQGKDIELVIDSVPPGASLEINGSVVGQTPHRQLLPKGYFGRAKTVMAKLLRGPWIATLRLDGYQTKEVELTTGPIEIRNLNGVYLGDYYTLRPSYTFALEESPSKTSAGASVANSAKSFENEAGHELRALVPSGVYADAGLTGLNASQQATLAEWLRQSASACSQVTSGSQERTAILSNIDGEFEGWDGETVFLLENGHIWRQAEYAYLYHYAYRPKVTIVRDSGSWTMTVEGVSESLRVERLR